MGRETRRRRRLRGFSFCFRDTEKAKGFVLEYYPTRPSSSPLSDTGPNSWPLFFTSHLYLKINQNKSSITKKAHLPFSLSSFSLHLLASASFFFCIYPLVRCPVFLSFLFWWCLVEGRSSGSLKTMAQKVLLSPHLSAFHI